MGYLRRSSLFIAMLMFAAIPTIAQDVTDYDIRSSMP